MFINREPPPWTDLLNDDIKDDIKCAKEVFNRNGLNAWKGWQNKCKSTSTTEKNKALPNLTNCAYWRNYRKKIVSVADLEEQNKWILGNRRIRSVCYCVTSRIHCPGQLLRWAVLIIKSREFPAEQSRASRSDEVDSCTITLHITFVHSLAFDSLYVYSDSFHKQS